jgi:hypothetical protein
MATMRHFEVMYKKFNGQKSQYEGGDENEITKRGS